MKHPVKESWQMTKAEWSKRPHFVSQNALHARYHQELTAKALSEGKPVPPEVLKDYPDLTM